MLNFQAPLTKVSNLLIPAGGTINRTKPSQKVSVTYLGKLPAISYQPKRERAAVRLGREQERNRFTVEALQSAIEAKLSFKMRIESDLRGSCAGGWVKCMLNNSIELLISTLPVSQEQPDGKIQTTFYVWEINVNSMKVIRARAGGNNRADLDLTVQEIRRTINGF